MYPNTIKNGIFYWIIEPKRRWHKKNAKHVSKDTPRRRRFGHKSVFLANFGSGLGTPGSQNRLQGAPGTLQNHHRSSSCRRNRPNRLPGGSRKAPRHTQGPPRDHFWMISDQFPLVILEWKVIGTLFSSRWCRICRISIKLNCWFEMAWAAGANSLNIDLSAGEYGALFSVMWVVEASSLNISSLKSQHSRPTSKIA